MDISVVIRTFNEGSKFGSVLRVIKNQKDVLLNEIIVIDSGSRDTTLEVAQIYGCRIIQMDPSEFSFGGALNLGAQASLSNIVVFISPDCLPISNKWLFYLVSPLLQENIAAVFGRQIPFNGVNPFEEVIIENSFPLKTKPDGSSPAGKYAFSNANCAIKRKFLIEKPFSEKIVAGEEWSIVNYILENGYRIIYEPKAGVYHSHSIKRYYLKAYIYSYGLCQTTSGQHFDNLGYLVAHYLFWLLKDFIYFIKKFNTIALLIAPIHELIRHFYLWKGSSDYQMKRQWCFNPILYNKLGYIVEKVTNSHSQTSFH